MLDFENLNVQNFDTLVKDAKRQISHFTDEWTNTQESDPGISLIEMFSWLKLLQNRKMNQVSDDSQYKFLELIGIRKIRNKGAKTLIEVKNVPRDISIPSGTKWCAGDIIFENDRPQVLLDCNIDKIEFVNPESSLKIDYDFLDGKRTFNLFGDFSTTKKSDLQREFKIYLSKPIQPNMDLNLYFDIYQPNGQKRNPVTHADDFIEMAKIVWELYGYKDGKKGWHKLDVILDDTHRFLFSGIVKLRIRGKMEQLGDCYQIRARFESEKYDLPPMITQVKTNVFSVTQKSTICENIVVKKREMCGTNRFALNTNLALYGENQIYINKDSRWMQINDFKVEKNIKTGRTSFNVAGISQDISKLENDDDAFMVVSYDKDIEDRIILGQGTGISDQQIDINFKDILYDDFKIMVGDNIYGEPLFDEWNKVDNFFSSGKYSKNYVLDCDKGLIKFGDNEKAIAPQRCENNIRLIGMAHTYGKGSNIKKGMINSIISQNPDINDLQIEQICDATGGIDTETFDDIRSRALDFLNETKKAVTIKDYENIVKSTPGLIVNNIKILPAYLPNKNHNAKNAVTIVVQDSTRRKDDALLESYQENIKRHIDKYRLINSRIVVTGPTYTGLKIAGNIVVNSYYQNYKDIVTEKIQKFVSDLNKNLGQTLYYGDLFGMVDRLECVSYVENIDILPIGNYKEKTLTDDIIVPPNGAYYIDKLDLNYIKSANI